MVSRDAARGHGVHRLAYLTSALVGAALWVGTVRVSGRREAWDAELYWTAAYPAAIVAAALLGALVPDRAWRWGLVIMLAQAVAGAVLARSVGLLPLGMMLFGVLALMPMAAAVGAARLRGRWSGGTGR